MYPWEKKNVWLYIDMDQMRIFKKDKWCIFNVNIYSNIQTSKEIDHQSCGFNPQLRMMTLTSNANTFRVTGPLWGKSIGPLWIPPQMSVTGSFQVFFLICVWTNGGWANNWAADDLRRHHGRYDAIAMGFLFSDFHGKAWRGWTSQIFPNIHTNSSYMHCA